MVEFPFFHLLHFILRIESTITSKFTKQNFGKFDTKSQLKVSEQKEGN